MISTVALPRVPPAWLEQTHDGALILIPLSFAGHGGLMALLARDAAGGTSGRFLSQYGGFMAVRSVPEPTALKIQSQLLKESLRSTPVPPEALSDGHPAAFYLSLRCPVPYKVIQFIPDDDSTAVQTWGQSTDGSAFVLLAMCWARAWWQWGKPEQTARALLAAHRQAPAEIRDRPVIRKIVSDLARQYPRAAGVRELATAVGHRALGGR